MNDQELFEQLSSFISDNKRMLFEKISAYRTRHICVVLDNIFQPHNASAVLRTCDLMGVQDIHVIEQSNRYTPSPDIALGSQKWMSIHHYDSGEDRAIRCIEGLRAKGYSIAATVLADDSIPLHEVPIDKPIALCFGTEMNGLSNELIDGADIKIRIPMFGFTESYNISVSAAIILYDLTQRLRGSEVNWQVSEEEILQLKLAWTRRVLKHAELVEQDIRDRNSKEQ